MDILLWFDLQSTWWASQPTEEELEKHVNVLAHYVRAEVVVDKVEPDLANYMENRDFSRSPNKSEIQLQSRYQQLGEEILKNILNRLNRLISYARTIKGQYWLVEYPVDLGRMHSFFQKFEAKGSIDSNKQFRFQPGEGDCISISMPSKDKYIKKEEWGKIKEFIEDTKRPPLVLELLAGAEQLEGNDYARSALSESVAALEVAIFSFGRAQDTNSQLASIVGPRLDIKRLSKQIEHMGLSGTIRYLIPLIITEEILPTDVLVTCQEAITERQNVIHNGKRNVNNVSKYIRAIRKCCKILDEFTENKEAQQTA